MFLTWKTPLWYDLRPPNSPTMAKGILPICFLQQPSEGTEGGSKEPKGIPLVLTLESSFFIVFEYPSANGVNLCPCPSGSFSNQHQSFTILHPFAINPMLVPSPPGFFCFWLRRPLDMKKMHAKQTPINSPQTKKATKKNKKSVQSRQMWPPLRGLLNSCSVFLCFGTQNKQEKDTLSVRTLTICCIKWHPGTQAWSSYQGPQEWQLQNPKSCSKWFIWMFTFDILWSTAVWSSKCENVKSWDLTNMLQEKGDSTFQRRTQHPNCDARDELLQAICPTAHW